jgi:hypothetical protein
MAGVTRTTLCLRASMLGLPLLGRSHGALVFDVGGSQLRFSPVPSTQPSLHTVVGFAGQDVGTVVDTLIARGDAMERFPGFPHDESGMFVTPDGARVAWFRDPDGNLLSVVRYVRECGASPGVPG